MAHWERLWGTISWDRGPGHGCGRRRINAIGGFKIEVIHIKKPGQGPSER